VNLTFRLFVPWYPLKSRLDSRAGPNVASKIKSLCRESNQHRKITHIECQKTRSFSHKFLELSAELKSVHLTWVHTTIPISLRVAILKKLLYWVGSWIGRSHPLPQGDFRSSSEQKSRI